MLGSLHKFISYSHGEKWLFWTLLGWVSRSCINALQYYNLPKHLDTFLYSIPRQFWHFNLIKCRPLLGSAFSQPKKLLEYFLAPWATIICHLYSLLNRLTSLNLAWSNFLFFLALSCFLNIHSTHHRVSREEAWDPCWWLKNLSQDPKSDCWQLKIEYVISDALGPSEECKRFAGEQRLWKIKQEDTVLGRGRRSPWCRPEKGLVNPAGVQSKDLPFEWCSTEWRWPSEPPALLSYWGLLWKSRLWFQHHELTEKQ